ncbi:hypothetical protein [Nocardia sp. NPDC051570]|uniref:hypothetical protein n=1 Tax=Nocardia sp. NPDC051570 TaxID=3364324 RepID=UPI0037A65B67
MTPETLVYALAMAGFAAMIVASVRLTGQPSRPCAPVSDWPRQNPGENTTRSDTERENVQRTGKHPTKYPTEPLPIPALARSGQVAALRHRFQPATTTVPPRRSASARPGSRPLPRR